MCPHPVAVSQNVDDVAMVKETIDQCRGHDLVPKYTLPVLEALVRRQHSLGALVACVDELEEQDRTLLAYRQVTDFVDYKQRRMREDLDTVCQVASCLGLYERLDQASEGAVIDTASGFGGSYREADRDVCLAYARRTKQDDFLSTIQEAEFLQALDLLALDTSLEGEVELRQHLDHRKP